MKTLNAIYIDEGAGQRENRLQRLRRSDITGIKFLDSLQYANNAVL
jgi:hypothetical protein